MERYRVAKLMLLVLVLVIFSVSSVSARAMAQHRVIVWPPQNVTELKACCPTDYDLFEDCDIQTVFYVGPLGNAYIGFCADVENWHGGPMWCMVKLFYLEESYLTLPHYMGDLCAGDHSIAARYFFNIHSMGLTMLDLPLDVRWEMGICSCFDDCPPYDAYDSDPDYPVFTLERLEPHQKG